jgi:hypothetical protein
LAKGTFVLWLLRQENEKEFTLENRTKLNELPGIKMAGNSVCFNHWFWFS